MARSRRDTIDYTDRMLEYTRAVIVSYYDSSDEKINSNARLKREH